MANKKENDKKTESASAVDSETVETGLGEQQGHGDFSVIGVGASAGGLEALKSFFDNLTDDCEHAFVIVQHLSPDYKSLMGELLSKNTALPIHQIEDDTEIESGNVYLIPPRKNLAVIDGCLRLLDVSETNLLHLPIDYFFRSLAEEYGSRSIGVVLSGTGSDGTRGIRAIKEAGGIVMVQSAASAKFNGMPNSAIATGCADAVLPVEMIPTELLELIEHPRSMPDTPERMLEQDDDCLRAIMREVSRHSGMDFESYKRPTLIRRMARRMVVRKLTQPRDYLDSIREEPEEITVLCKEFLIGVTRFFRDQKAFEIIENDVLPALIRAKKSEGKMKLWSIGCSSGEEAYSLAILVQEVMQKMGVTLEVKILATDLDSDHIATAARGLFPESIAGDMNTQRLEKYFDREGDYYRVKQHIRTMVIFSRHDALKDPPFTRVDLLVCRNMMIYLQQTAQQRLLSLMHYALNVDGVLFIGPSESIGELRNWFEEVDRHWKIYRNKELARPQHLAAGGLHDWSKASFGTSDNGVTQRQVRLENRLAEMLNETLSSEFGLAAIFVDGDFNIIHGVGELNRYLRLKAGRLSFNLMSMLPETLAGSVRAAVYKAADDGEKILYKGISVTEGRKSHILDVMVKPYKTGPALGWNYLIVLIETRVLESADVVVDGTDMNDVERERVKVLEQELQTTRENLQATIEEVETSNEELQATNEELLASNEELQSTNEELQSVNEELHTVNTEHQQKVEELALLSAEMESLFASTEIGTIFLDKDMCIRKFNSSVTEHFQLRNIDIGRPIQHFSANFAANDSNELLEQTRNVLLTGATIEREISTTDGKWFLQRITPFKGEDGGTEGVVITFVDIRQLKLAEYAISNSENKYRKLYNESPLMYVSLNVRSGRIEGCNETVCSKLGYARQDVIGRTLFDFYHPDSLEAVRAALATMRETGGVNNAELQMLKKDGEVLDVMLNARAVSGPENQQVLRCNATFTDITELKAARRLLDRHVEHLEHFAYVATHDLRGPVVNLSALMEMVKDKGWTNAENKKVLGKLDVNIQRMDDALSGLIELVKNPESGRTAPVLRVEFSQVMEEVSESIETQIKSTKAHIQTDFSGAPGITYSPSHLRSIFQNLISNALKYRHPKREPVLVITSSATKDGVEILFEDNGRGISLHHQERIFELFFQSTPANEGQGVGLYIVKTMLESRGGYIEVESESGEGTKFKMFLKNQPATHEPNHA